MDALVRKVRAVLDAHLPPSGDVAVAVSGGSDSMCLLSALTEGGLADASRIVVVNVEHGIRGEESERDSAFVAEYCAKHGLRLIAEKCDVPRLARERGVGEETAARDFRASLFVRLVLEGRAVAVLTAHHAYDRTESLLMHIFRGSGLKGLAGMSEHDGAIVRPLLHCTKAEINEYIAEHSVPYVEDSTNADSRYTRNFLRNEVLPLLRSRYPGLDDALARLSDAVRAVTDAQDFGSRVRRGPRGSALVPAEGLTGSEVVAAFLAAGLTADFTSAHVAAVLALADLPCGKGVDLPHGYRAEREADAVRVFEDRSVPEVCVPFALGETDLDGGLYIVAEEVTPRVDKTRTIIDLDKLPSDAVVRTRRRGDRFTPFGGREQSLSDWLIDKKVPRFIRKDLLYVASGDEVLAVVGIATGEKLKIDKTTKRAALLRDGTTSEDV